MIFQELMITLNTISCLVQIIKELVNISRGLSLVYMYNV